MATVYSCVQRRVHKTLDCWNDLNLLSEPCEQGSELNEHH